MAKPSALPTTNTMTAIRAQGPHASDGQDVPPHWRTMAIGFAILLVVVGIFIVIKKCLPRCLSRKVSNSAVEEPQISIISSNGLSKETRNGNGNFSSNIQVGSGQRGSKQLTLDINLSQHPDISVEPASPSCECGPEDVQPSSEPSATEWVTSTPPPPPPGTLLWVPSTARRRSVSLRGDSDDEKEEKSLCSSCGASMTPSASPPNSMTLERKRSVTFNTNVEEIHVLSNEPKKPRSRSPSLLNW